MNDSTDIEPVAVPEPAAAPRRRRKRTRKEPHWPWFLGGVVMGMLLLASSLWVYDRIVADFGAVRGGSAAAAAGDARNVLGSPNAPVTIVEYSDFRCGFCRRAYTTSNKQIMDTYVAAGQVRFVYKHLAVLGPDSLAAAIAAECAADQGKFWEYHDGLFDYQVDGGTLDRSSLSRVAQQVGLEAERFNTCVDTQATLARVQADMQEAQSYGFSGTPSYLVAGTPIIGAQPFTAFAQVIDAALK